MFGALLSQKQEKFDPAYLDLQDRFDVAEGKGILKDMVQNHKSVNYGTLQLEACSLQELKDLQLRKFSANDPSFALKVEQAIVQYIKSEFPRDGLTPDVKSRFQEAIKYHNDSLANLLDTITSFSGQINETKKANAFEKRIKDFSLPFSQIISSLEAA